MKLFSHSLSTVKSLTVLTLMACLVSTNAMAAARITLSGATSDVKYETDSDIRLSLIDWSTPEQQDAVESAWRQYNDDGDLEAFMTALQEQESRGYLFSAAAIGYSIKYAWQEETPAGKHMRFLVTPGLKTRNPYLWNTPNNASPEFTLVEVQLDSETGVAKTSLDGEIGFNENGQLVLDRFEDLNLFATMEDSTPYYLE